MYAKAQEEGLIPSRHEFDEAAMIERKACKVDTGFIFVLSDAHLEE